MSVNTLFIPNQNSIFAANGYIDDIDTTPGVKGAAATLNLGVENSEFINIGSSATLPTILVNGQPLTGAPTFVYQSATTGAFVGSNVFTVSVWTFSGMGFIEVKLNTASITLTATTDLITLTTAIPLFARPASNKSFVAYQSINSVSTEGALFLNASGALSMIPLDGNHYENTQPLAMTIMSGVYSLTS